MSNNAEPQRWNPHLSETEQKKIQTSYLSENVRKTLDERAEEVKEASKKIVKTGDDPELGEVQNKTTYDTRIKNAHYLLRKLNPSGDYTGSQWETPEALEAEVKRLRDNDPPSATQGQD